MLHFIISTDINRLYLTCLFCTNLEVKKTSWGVFILGITNKLHFIRQAVVKILLFWARLITSCYRCKGLTEENVTVNSTVHDIALVNFRHQLCNFNFCEFFLQYCTLRVCHMQPLPVYHQQPVLHSHIFDSFLKKQKAPFIIDILNFSFFLGCNY